MTCRRLSVLIVIHNQRSLRLVASALLSEGHHIYIAASGAEALVHFAPERYDFVVTDFAVTSQDGLELTEFIRRRSPAQKICFLAIRLPADGATQAADSLFGEALCPETVVSVVRQLDAQRELAGATSI